MPTLASTRAPNQPATTLGLTGPQTGHHFLQASLVTGFGCAALTWAAWLILAMPWLGLSPMFISLGVLGVWLVVAAWMGRLLADRPWTWAALIGGAGGLVTAGVNVLLLGSKLVEAADPTDLTQGQGVPHPDAGLAVAGFMLAGVVIGSLGGLFGSLSAGSVVVADGRRWFARFSLITALACGPLLLLGGAVTSTESGMAVSGWPDTFGANMFLYPISLMSEPRVFMEHAHRLFGAMVGLTILTQWLMALVVVRTGVRESIVGVVIGLIPLAVAFATGSGMRLGAVAAAVGIIAAGWMVTALLRGRLSAAAGGLLVLVIAQGIMGGTRVTESSALLAVVHGVSGQVLVALAATLALCAFPGFASAVRTGGVPIRAAQLLAGALILQLIFGALFRHLRREELSGASHAMWSHVIFSVVVVGCAVITGMVLSAKRDSEHSKPRGAIVVGKALVHTVGLQFLLGWAAFGAVHMADQRVGVPTVDQLATAPVVPWWEALIATVHQGNGALLLVLGGLAVAWSLRLKLPCGSRNRPSVG
jgi:heme a synthase